MNPRPYLLLLLTLALVSLSGCMVTEPTGEPPTIPLTSSGETQLCVEGESAPYPWAWGVTVVTETLDTLVVEGDTVKCRTLGRWSTDQIRSWKLRSTGRVTRAWIIERGDTIDVTSLAKKGTW